ncbi:MULTISPECIES: DNA repair protein RadC [unclassified Enterococcus]|uniref:RadC family protein n=1 Tax=unclassified Enterococcus TaxID=2608891 RepID=UPI00155567BD|nr:MULTISPECIES: DNA repair protein RadC [unclassified Enterococcus]MBS7577405.1 DNA repair protein RadC [Enterococcus sp. MMGLQ5-2]MBS7584812.1 DNA repair protein RadC [Enterococcus sp. MMGLQ5-1]NPD12667.1 DNA repair protein RadC [Enterococcus sp. MMGLQ5-1]NPD37239.1 DNA repair protein RadC [Enterococcus sp. MMGLQ5-2]
MKPRERLYLLGPEQLSHVELLAILLRTGTSKSSATQLADKLLGKYENLSRFEEASIEDLLNQSGIGLVKAIEIKAMVELGKRIYQSANPKPYQVLGSESFAKTLMPELGRLKQEHLIAFFLDAKNQIIRRRTIFIGSLNQSIAHPREILHYSVKYMAAAIILAHNHPSGIVNPSYADQKFTQKMKESCQIIGIELIDHLIIGRSDYYSFKAQQKI